MGRKIKQLAAVMTTGYGKKITQLAAVMTTGYGKEDNAASSCYDDGLWEGR